MRPTGLPPGPPYPAALPDVLLPGEGARVLEPVVGANSVILLDEGAHMSQRKLMLPAFQVRPSRGASSVLSDRRRAPVPA